MSLIFPRAFAPIFPEIRQAFRMLDQGPFATFPRAFENFHSALSAESKPALDVQETENDYQLSVELPGVKKDDLKLSFSEDGSTLTLSGQIRRAWSNSATTPVSSEPTSTSDAANAEAKSTSNESTSEVVQSSDKSTDVTHYSERYTGSFSRSLRFPSLVDSEKTKASLIDGILNVIVPKRAGSQKTVSIE